MKIVFLSVGFIVFVLGALNMDHQAAPRESGLAWLAFGLGIGIFGVGAILE